jgi:hypothetical protein
MTDTQFDNADRTADAKEAIRADIAPLVWARPRKD